MIKLKDVCSGKEMLGRPTPQYETLTVLGVPLHTMSASQAVDLVVEAATKGKSLSCSSVGMHTLVSAHKDASVRASLSRIDLRLIDSTPVQFYLRNRGFKNANKTRGQELLRSICRRCEDENLSIFVLGSNSTSLDLLAKRLAVTYPRLRIAGMKPGRYRDLSQAEIAEDLRDIVESGAQLVFVGLGSPRQDKWIAENASILQMPLIAVGAAIDFESGAVPVAPIAVQNAGWEWLYRLYCDPVRLWRRYLIQAPYFAWLLLTQKSDPGDPPA